MGVKSFFTRSQSSVVYHRSGQTVKIDGNTYPVNSSYGMEPSSMAASRPRVMGDLEGIAKAASSNSIVASAVAIRQYTLSSLKFIMQHRVTKEYYNHKDLGKFENPGPYDNLPFLLKLAESHVSHAGIALFYWNPMKERLRLLRPDFCEFIIGSDRSPSEVENALKAPVEIRREALQYAIDGEVEGLIYQPPGLDPEVIPIKYIVRWIPEPHPVNPFLGSAWITSVVREMAAEEQADIYADKFFEQGATPRLVYRMDPNTTQKESKKWKKVQDALLGGVMNSHRTLWVGGAADVKIVGTGLGDLALDSFRRINHQNIAGRSQLPPSILQIASGSEGSSLNQGNYESARRQFTDLFFANHANGLVTALRQIAPGNRNLELVADPRDNLLLQEDMKESTEILQARLSAMNTGITAGFIPDQVVRAVNTGNLKLLHGQHTGLVSVQLLPPGTVGKGQEEPVPEDEEEDKKSDESSDDKGESSDDNPGDDGGNDDKIDE